MEFDEHEDEEEEIVMQTGNFGNSSSAGRGVEDISAGIKGNSSGGTNTTTYRYRECLKNHAVGVGGHAVDGCGEFMPAGEEGTLDALKCAACNCHRNFHRKESQGEGFHHPTTSTSTATHHHHNRSHHRHRHHQFYSFGRSVGQPPSGYLHVTSPRPLALPSTSREDEDVSNPSSSGGGGGSRKRFRTKFTAEQKDKMLGFAERVGWRIQKQDEEAVQQFCAETNVKRQVLKVWMHNNKHTLGKKP